MRVTSISAFTTAVTLISPATASACRFFHDADCHKLAQKEHTAYDCHNSGLFFNPGRYVRCYTDGNIRIGADDLDVPEDVHVYGCRYKQCQNGRKSALAIPIHAGYGGMAWMHPKFGHGIPPEAANPPKHARDVIDVGIGNVTNLDTKNITNFEISNMTNIENSNITDLATGNITAARIAQSSDDDYPTYDWPEQNRFLRRRWFSYCHDLGERIRPWRTMDCFVTSDDALWPIYQEGGMWEGYPLRGHG